MKHLIRIVVIILLTSAHTYAQQSSINWTDIETSIRRRWLLQEVQEKLLRYKEKAIRENDDITVARCFHNLLKITDIKSEDSMFLRNSAFMDSILKHSTSPSLLTSITHLMKAKRLKEFRHRFFYGRNKQALSGVNDEVNYGTIGIGELDSIILKHLSQALQEAKNFNYTDGRQLLWLSSSPETFLFEPRFIDIAYAEQAAFLDLISYKIIDQLDWLNLSQDEFFNMTDPALYFDESNLKVYNCFKDWANTHFKKLPGTFYYIESLARKSLYQKGSADSTKKALYETYLQRLINSQYPIVRANGVFQLCLAWNEHASHYGEGDTLVNGLYRKTLDLYHQHKATLDSFIVLNQLLATMEKKIIKPEFRFSFNLYQLPGEQIPVELKFRNTGKLYYRAVRVSETKEHLDSKEISFLISQPEADSGVHTTLALQYFHWQDTTVHINPLAPGKYMFFYSDQPLDEGYSRIEYLPIHVTNIVMIKNDSRLFILDRKTGQPLIGANVLIEGINRPLQVNENGYVINPKKKSVTVTVYKGLDTLSDWTNERRMYNRGNIYDKEEYDDLAEFYEDNVQLHMFTDRSVYRPGQTVHYKGILMAPDPKTGKTEILNWKNLGYPAITKLYLRLLVKLGKKRINIFINDSFGREVDSIKVLPNAYGSFAGSFVIPKNAATGEWDFSCEEFENADENEGTFKVEEYKRPTFELVLKKPEGELYLGDPFNVKMIARSFTGASMNNVSLRYQVNSRGYNENFFLQGEVQTNAKGEYDLRINDTLGRRLMLEGKARNAWYDITVTAIDGTGENHEESLQVDLRSTPVMIDIRIPSVFEKNKLSPVFISAKTELSQPLVKSLEVKLYEVNDGEKLLYTTTHTTGENNKFSLPTAIIGSGYYELEANCYKDGRLAGTTRKTFKVFDPLNGSFPILKDPFHHLVTRSTGEGIEINWYSGNSLGEIYSIYQVTYLVKGKSGLTEKYDYVTRTENKGLQEWKYRLPSSAVEKALLTHIYVFNNRLYRKEEQVFIPRKESENPELIIEQYRKKIVPGEKETFNVSIKTSDGKKAMELMTGMYDASLEKIEPHSWHLPYRENYIGVRSNWNRSINRKNSKQVSEEVLIKDLPVLLQGRVAGLSVMNTDGLNEVVVVGYGTARKMELTGSVAVIRGMASLSDYKGMLIILDGQVYEKDLSTLNLDAITGSIVLKGAEATELYGARAAGGVLIMSTKGPVQLPEKKEEVPVKIRKNFSETAFFYPQLHAGRDGLYHISFTMPESVTEWNWKMLAHDKRSAFIYEERKIVSQLPLMVQPDMPRFLYQGDQLVLKTRIINLDTIGVSGSLKCIIEDAVTGEDLTFKLLSSFEQRISVDPSSNGFASFRLSIPVDFLHPLVIRVKARAGNFSDGEEYTIPVLSRKVLVSRQVPVTVDKGTSVQVPLSPLPVNAEPHAVSLGISPKAQATLINALPYLALYPYGCTEQTFNKLLAYTTARNLLRTDTGLARAWNLLRSDTAGSGLAPLPYEPEEQTMPWLQMSHAHALNQQKLKLIFDTLPAGEQVKKLLVKIMEAGNADGGVSWFKGGKSSSYISAYLLAGFGKLKQDKLLSPMSLYDDKFHTFIRNLVKYCDSQFGDTLNLVDPLEYLYARTYWKSEYPMKDSLKLKAERALEASWQLAGSLPVNLEARLITVTLRYAQPGSPLYRNAQLQLEAIRQLAIHDEAGTRWKALSDTDDLNVSKEECIAMIAEAFETAGSSPETVDGIVKWLLREKSNHAWGTTKATAAVTNLLVKHPGYARSSPSGLHTEWNNKPLRVTDNLFTGKLGDFVLLQGGSIPAELKVSRTSSDTTAGEIMLYYFSDMQDVEEASPVRISKTYRLFNTAANTWETIDPSAFRLKPGDKVEVRLSIETGRMLKYVFLDDRRAACFEPLNDRSGHEYENGIAYYKSIRDAGYQFFAESIPAGTSTLTYQVTVSKQGVFSTGMPSLQCMYQPGVRAYGKNVVVTVE